MLSDLGVASLLVERHATTALLPKAHIINPRSMEILHLHGMAEEVCREGAPPENNASAQWYTSLGGDEPWHRQQVHRVDAWSGGALTEQYARITRWRHGNLPQKHLEPLLRRHAEARNPGGVRFATELVDIAQDSDGVQAVIRDLDTAPSTRCAPRTRSPPTAARRSATGWASRWRARSPSSTPRASTSAPTCRPTSATTTRACASSCARRPRGRGCARDACRWARRTGTGTRRSGS